MNLEEKQRDDQIYAEKRARALDLMEQVRYSLSHAEPSGGRIDASWDIGEVLNDIKVEEESGEKIVLPNSLRIQRLIELLKLKEFDKDFNFIPVEVEMWQEVKEIANIMEKIDYKRYQEENS